MPRGNVLVALLFRVPCDNYSVIVIQDNYGNMPLHSAAVANDVEMIRALLNLGAQIDAKNWVHSRSYLILACKVAKPASLISVIFNGDSYCVYRIIIRPCCVLRRLGKLRR
jgi:ankyrin repeat protein